jgi:hypothetical protein
VADGQRDPDTTKKMVNGIAALTRQLIKVLVIGSEHGDTGGNASFPSTVTIIKSPLSTGKQTALRMGSTEIQVLDRGRAHTGTDLEVYLPKEKICSRPRRTRITFSPTCVRGSRGMDPDDREHPRD